MFLLNDARHRVAERDAEPARSFVFGYLGGPPLPFAETHPGASFILAFQALPLVLTISALASLLFHWGVLQRITAGIRLAAAPRDGDRRRRWRSAPRCTCSSA